MHNSGIALRLLSVALITAMSAVVHGAAQSVPIGQLIFWRSLIAILPIVIYIALRGQISTAFYTRNPRAHAERSLFGVVTMALSFVSLAYLPVANASALAYLAPLMSLPMAAMILKERLSISVILACTLGFSGVILMLISSLQSPTSQWSQYIGIAAGLGYAVMMGVLRVHIKAMTATETPATIAFYFAVIGAVLGALSALWGWAALTPETLLLLVLAGLLGGMAHIASAEAVARAPVSTLAPFDYTGMVWALGFDIVLFNTMPDIWSGLGVMAILAAAMLAIRADIRPSTAARTGR